MAPLILVRSTLLPQMPKNIPVRLTDGLVVTRQSDIHPRRGTYTVLVVIEAPKPSPDLAEPTGCYRASTPNAGGVRWLR